MGCKGTIVLEMDYRVSVCLIIIIIIIIRLYIAINELQMDVKQYIYSINQSYYIGGFLLVSLFRATTPFITSMVPSHLTFLLR